MLHPLRTLTAALVAAGLLAAPRSAFQEDDSHDVRLVVLVVVDQLIPEHLERLGPLLEGGLGRFVSAGRVWRRAAHMHAVTSTGPGHATLSTGVHPNRHGIVANSWLPLEERGSVYCVEDDSVLVVTNAGPLPAADAGRRSPANMLAPGIADHLREHFPGSRSVSIGAKDRAAVPGGGQHPDIALWWDRRGYGFVSSTWYTEELPGWAQDWNENWTRVFTQVGGFVWEDTLPEGAEGWTGTAPDERATEYPQRNGRSMPHDGPTFPLPLDARARLGLSTWVLNSPLADAFVCELAERAVREGELGRDEEVDFLFVGLASCDTVGHLNGPYSHEVTDVLLRADRALGRLFATVDEVVGAGRWVAALSSDHGVLPLPERLQAEGIPARRINAGPVAAALTDHRKLVAERAGGDFYVHHDSTGVRLSGEQLLAAGADPAVVQAEYAEALETADTVLRAIPVALLARLVQEGAPPDPLAKLFARSYYPGRSPDVYLVPHPWQIDVLLGTGHGSPWAYDREVPVAFLGPGVEPGESFEACATVDVAPTLLHLAGVPAPAGLDGRVLEQRP